jgi:NADH:ubiquinone oxidoreductase subunit 5 (subunit L)/multisubunit Na+/H+ antiporter MnhA subunit
VLAALAALLGMLVLGTAAHFMTLFLGLEMLSLALYVLAGFAGGRHHSRERPSSTSCCRRSPRASCSTASRCSTA